MNMPSAVSRITAICPLFVLLSLSAPRLPNHPLPAYAHSSGRGAFGDVVRDITDVLISGEASPHDEMLLFDNETVVGIRTQRWKYLDTAYYRGLRMSLAWMEYDQLYDLSTDPGENYNVGADYPDVLADMRARCWRGQRDERL